jgi:hypothetical protein
MNIDNLALDREHYAKVQEALERVNDLIRVERRLDPVYASIRADLWDASTHLRRVLATYRIMLKEHPGEKDSS